MKKPWNITTFFLFVIGLLFLTGCPAKPPKEGTFLIRVQASDSERKGIAKAIVKINKKKLGTTNEFGTFLGTYRGKVNSRIRIRVEGPGVDNYVIMTSRLRVKKTKNGWDPIPIKVEAFLRSDEEGEGGGPIEDVDASEPPEPKVIAQLPPSNRKKSKRERAEQAKRERAEQAEQAEKAKRERAEQAKQTKRERAEQAKQAKRERAEQAKQERAGQTEQAEKAKRERAEQERAERERAEKAKQAELKRLEQERAARPAPIPSWSGKYKITASSNVKGVYVYRLLGRRKKYAGKTKSNGGFVTIKHQSKSKSPISLKLLFWMKGRSAYIYKESKIIKEITLEPGRADYSTEVTFEKKPEIVLTIRSNIDNVSVSLGRSRRRSKTIGVISSADEPLKYTYKGRSRSFNIYLKPKNRKIRPRIVQKKVRILEDQSIYILEAKFTKPLEKVAVIEPPRRRDPEPIRPKPPAYRPDPIPSVVRRDRMPKPPKPPKPPRFDGRYRITVNSNAPVTIYKSRVSRRNKLGAIGSGGGSKEVSHRDLKKSPSMLRLILVTKDRSFRSSKKTQKVLLEYGRATYNIEVNFEKLESISINFTCSLGKAYIYMGRKKLGSAGTGAPYVYAYTGKSRSLSFKFKSATNGFKLLGVTSKRITFSAGQTSYSHEIQMKENEGPVSVIKPKCLKRKRGKRRVVALLASAKTRFVLKNCDEFLAKAGRAGSIQVSLPVGSFQRIRAIFPGGSKSDKVIEVKRGTSPLRVRFSRVGKGCNLPRIKKKIRNKIFLEQEEVTCLQKVPSSNKQHFSAQIYLSRFYCQKKVYANGKRILGGLYSKGGNRFNPYRAMQMGIEYGRCRQYRRSIALLKQAERFRGRFNRSDRYTNTKSLYKALASLYESRYYRQKSTSDLTLALKKTQRLLESLRASDSRERSRAKKDVARLQKMIKKRGGLEE